MIAKLAFVAASILPLVYGTDNFCKDVNPACPNPACSFGFSDAALTCFGDSYPYADCLAPTQMTCLCRSAAYIAHVRQCLPSGDIVKAIEFNAKYCTHPVDCIPPSSSSSDKPSTSESHHSSSEHPSTSDHPSTTTEPSTSDKPSSSGAHSSSETGSCVNPLDLANLSEPVKDCFENGLVKSGCAAGDTICLCGNAAYNEAVAVCVAANAAGSIPEALSFSSSICAHPTSAPAGCTSATASNTGAANGTTTATQTDNPASCDKIRGDCTGTAIPVETTSAAIPSAGFQSMTVFGIIGASIVGAFFGVLLL